MISFKKFATCDLGTALNVLKALFYFILISILEGKQDYYFYFIEKQASFGTLSYI